MLLLRVLYFCTTLFKKTNTQTAVYWESLLEQARPSFQFTTLELLDFFRDILPFI